MADDETTRQRPERESRDNGRSDRGVPADSPDLIASLVHELEALAGYATHLAHTQLDLARWRLRTLVLGAVVGGIALACLTALAVFAGMQVIGGVAGGLGALTGSAWLGELLAGMLALGGLAGAAAWAIVRSQRNWQHKKTCEYEERKALQRARYGRDVDDAARDAA